MINDLSYKEQRVLFAKLAGIAYQDIKEARSSAKLLGFTKTTLVDEDGAQTYVFNNKHDVVIACRGTEPTQMNDIYADLEIFKADSVTGNKIHQGFKEEVDKVYDQVESLLDRVGMNKSIWSCGHSLGGAMATILSQRLEYRDGHNIDTLFTFGSPRAGGPLFSKWCDTNLNHQRFVNNNDVVPCVPSVLRWRHTGDCYYIKSTGKITRLGRWSSERIRDKGTSLIKTILKGRLDFVADHNIDDYIMHLENDQKLENV
tara:strand:- start:4639 stop:5412 length:774 start_codon:yes stop_codon:yes gene_type:complete